MRIGLLGPSQGEYESLRDAAEFLIGDLRVEQVIYLGDDDAISRLLLEGTQELGGHRNREEAFLEQAYQVALNGNAGQIEALLDSDVHLARLAEIRTVPPHPSRAIEMIDDRIITFVFDKAALDEEDIANASVIVFGKSEEMLLRRFGPRYFFTPGPLSMHKVGVLELEEDGRVAIAAYEPSGAPLWREVLQHRGTKLTVVE